MLTGAACAFGLGSAVVPVQVLALLTPQMNVDPVQLGVLVVTHLALGMLTPQAGILLRCGHR